MLGLVIKQKEREFTHEIDAICKQSEKALLAVSHSDNLPSTAQPPEKKLDNLGLRVYFSFEYILITFPVWGTKRKNQQKGGNKWQN